MTIKFKKLFKMDRDEWDPTKKVILPKNENDWAYSCHLFSSKVNGVFCIRALEYYDFLKEKIDEVEKLEDLKFIFTGLQAFYEMMLLGEIDYDNDAFRGFRCKNFDRLHHYSARNPWGFPDHGKGRLPSFYTDSYVGKLIEEDMINGYQLYELHRLGIYDIEDNVRNFRIGLRRFKEVVSAVFFYGGDTRGILNYFYKNCSYLFSSREVDENPEAIAEIIGMTDFFNVESNNKGPFTFFLKNFFDWLLTENYESAVGRGYPPDIIMEALVSAGVLFPSQIVCDALLGDCPALMRFCSGDFPDPRNEKYRDYIVSNRIVFPESGYGKLAGDIIMIGDVGSWDRHYKIITNIKNRVYDLNYDLYDSYVRLADPLY